MCLGPALPFQSQGVKTWTGQAADLGVSGLTRQDAAHEHGWGGGKAKVCHMSPPTHDARCHSPLQKRP